MKIKKVSVSPLMTMILSLVKPLKMTNRTLTNSCRLQSPTLARQKTRMRSRRNKKKKK